jgi:glucose-1-phosphate thymidylyltransferase
MDSGRSLKGEYYLADAIQVMIDEGAKFKTFPVQAWEDTGTWDAVLHANRYLLGKMDQNKEPYMLGSSLVIPPSFVSPNSTVENSIVGPYAAISEGAAVCDAIVKNSVVGPNANVTGAMLFGSMVGERAAFEGSYQSLNIGDDSVARIIGENDAEVDETFK